MIIKESDKGLKKTFATLFQPLSGKKGGIIGALLCSGLFFLLGAVAQKNGFTGRIVEPILNIDYRLPYHFVKGRLSNPIKINIDIEFEDYRKLAYLREIALKKGRIITTDSSYVPATVRVGEKVVEADIRLKGDLTDHAEGDKWSLRIKVKGDDAILGMKRFSIQDPKLSAYIFEWVAYELYKYEGLIALRYNYVDVILNGKKMGVYALEESFSDELIEHNQRKAGPIIKFDESQLHDGTRGNPGTVQSKADIFFSRPIDSFRTKKTKSDSSRYVQYLTAKKLLEDFRAGRINASQAFDIEKAAKLYALANLLSNSAHAVWWKNVRFYYNPITAKLELIGYNAYGTRHYKLSAIKNIIWKNAHPESPNQFIVDQYHDRFFSDSVFVRSYLGTLGRISKKQYLVSFFNLINPRLEENLNFIHRDHPSYVFRKQAYYKNQNVIRGTLNPALPISAKIVVDSSLNSDGLQLSVANTGFLPIELTSIESVDGGVALLSNPVALKGKSPSQPLSYRELTLAESGILTPEIDIKQGVIVRYHVVGSKQIRSITVTELDLSGASGVLSSKLSESRGMSAKMLKRDEENRTITIRTGIWDVTEDIVIPQGYQVICGQGTKINLLNSSSIFSHSRLLFQGTKEHPILITSSDLSGQGLFVLQTEEKSMLRHVHFDKLSNPTRHGWALTAAVTFYEADVSIDYCVFSSNQKGDDYINLIRSEFDISHTRFRNVYADAIDADFCTGIISNVSFEVCGNDGIDISGSKIDLGRAVMHGIGDKGLSVGEDSRMFVKHIKVTNSEIAICSKDNSKIIIKEAILERNKIAFTAFQKKPEFGPGMVIVSNLQVRENQLPHLIEENSSLMIAGKAVEAGAQNVKKMLYGVKFGRSSD